MNGKGDEDLVASGTVTVNPLRHGREEYDIIVEVFEEDITVEGIGVEDVAAEVAQAKAGEPVECVEFDLA